MRALKLAVSVVAGLSFLALLVVGIPSSSRAQGDLFTLKVCNTYGKPFLLSLVHRVTPADQRFVVKGWFVVESGCATTDLPRGEFGTFAYVQGRSEVEKIWGGNIPICVTVGKNFERIVSSNYRCRKEIQELVVPFQGWKVTDEPGMEIEFK